MSEPTTKAGRALHDWLGWHPIDGRDDRILAIEVEAYERGCVAGMAMEKYAPQPDTASRELREAAWSVVAQADHFTSGPLWDYELANLRRVLEAGDE